METYGLIGWPLGHSFSAGYFQQKFQKEGIDAEYLNFEIPEVADYLPKLLSQHPTLRGLNVTIPHKQAVMPFLDELSDEARIIGAVNVISVKHTADGYRLVGYNSDIVGFTRSIRPLLTDFHRHALVLGTGGASKAVVRGLERLGIEPILVSRTPSEGQLAYGDITPQLLKTYTVIVNCSPVGMHPHVDECPPLPYDALTPDHLLYDLVYNPLETKFLKQGAEHGAVTKNGLEMLHLQADASWDFWHK